MKKWIGSLMLVGLTSVVFAQAPFTIVRPPDGAKIKESVKVLIPKGSIPEGGYVGVFLGGKFLEATVPPLHGKYYEYTLDPKKLGIPDTEPGKPLKLELVLYVDYEKASRIVDRTSVDLNIANHDSITVPNEGIKLRYILKPGTRLVYRLDQQVSTSSISETENSLGGRPAEFTQDGETIRLQYEAMNTYGAKDPEKDILLRIQALPEKGKDYALLTADGDQTQKKWMDYEMAPIYMRINSTGKEIFGSLPIYTPLEGTSGGGTRTDLFVPYPLPTLPIKPVHVGDAWASQFQQGDVDMTKFNELESVVEDFPARGEFVDTEWESGHPCAKIRHSIEAGTSTTKGKQLKKEGKNFSDDKISLQETIWFALDTHQVIKVIRDETLETKVQSTQMGGPGMGMGGPGMPPGMGGPGMPPGAGGPGAAGSGDRFSRMYNALQRGKGPGVPGAPGMGGPPPGFGPGMGGPGGRMGPGGPGNFGQGGRNGAPQAPTSTYIRIRTLRTFTLEQN